MIKDLEEEINAKDEMYDDVCIQMENLKRQLKEKEEESQKYSLITKFNKDEFKWIFPINNNT